MLTIFAARFLPSVTSLRDANQTASRRDVKQIILKSFNPTNPSSDNNIVNFLRDWGHYHHSIEFVDELSLLLQNAAPMAE